MPPVADQQGPHSAGPAALRPVIARCSGNRSSWREEQMQPLGRALTEEEIVEETLSVSAIANRSAEEVAERLCGLTSRCGIPTEVSAGPEAEADRDTLVRPAQGGW